MRNPNLEELNVSELIKTLRKTLYDIRHILSDYHGAPESRERLLNLFVMVDDVSDLITKIIKSGKHKLKKNEVKKLTQLTEEKIPSVLRELIITQIKSEKEIRWIKKFLLSIIRCMERSPIITDIRLPYGGR